MRTLSNVLIKVFFLACVISKIFLSTSILSFAISSDDTPNSYESSIETAINELTNNTVYSLNNSTEFTSFEFGYTINGPINSIKASTRITFDASDVSNYSFEEEGISVLENQTTPMVFDLIADAEYGRFEVEAEMVNGEIIKKTIYT